MARHTRCEVVGIWMSVTPKWRSASSTPFTMAGVEAMVPASPQPLIPRGFEGQGVTVMPTWKNWENLLSIREFQVGLLNSTIISIGAATLALVLGTLAAYAFARYRFRGRNVAFALVLVVVFSAALLSD